MPDYMLDYSSHTQMIRTGVEGEDKIPRYIARGKRVNGFICLMDVTTMGRKVVKRFKSIKRFSEWLVENQEYYNEEELAAVVGFSDGE
jgi:hypothetical protein